MKNHLKQAMDFFRFKRKNPIDQKQFEEDPVKVRTAETSQFQDEARDIETRSPERSAFEDKVFKSFHGK